MNKYTVILIVLALAILPCLFLECFVYESPSVPSPFWGAKEAFRDAGLSEEEYEPCLIWAFGEEWNKTTINSLMDIWRQRHSDLFIIRDADYAYDAFKRIGEAYKNQEVEPEADAPRISFSISSPPEQQGVLYFDAEEGKFKFEGDADLAAQRLFEMAQSAVDEYIKENCND